MWSQGTAVFTQEGVTGGRTGSRVGARPVRSRLTVDALRFYVAMCRGRLLKAPWIEDAVELSALMVSHPRHFDLDVRNRLLLTGTSYRFADFERSAFPGRIGNAVALLVAEAHGYCWFAHFEEVAPANLRGAGRAPDFLAASDQSLAVVEAKGSCARKQSPSTFRSKVEREHNSQCLPWLKKGKGAVDTAVTVGTRVTDKDPAHAWVKRDARRRKARPATTIVWNYRPWFTLAGVHDLGQAILNGGANRSAVAHALRSYGLTITWRNARFVVIAPDEDLRASLLKGVMPLASPLRHRTGPLLVAFPEVTLEALLAMERSSVDEVAKRIAASTAAVAADVTGPRHSKLDDVFDESPVPQATPESSAALHRDGMLVLQDLREVNDIAG